MVGEIALLIETAFPGETVRSVLGRHILQTAIPPQELLHKISGRAKVRVHPLLPCFLKGMERVGFGSAESLLRNHTLYDVYAWFMKESRAVELRSAMFDMWPSKVARLTRWSANQLCILRADRLCPECARDDIQQFGVCYGHLEHQVPNVHACWKHGVGLYAVPLLTSGWDQFHNIRSDLSGRSAPQRDISFAKFVATQVPQIVSRPRDSELCHIYRMVLAKEGLITTNGRVRRRLLLCRIAPFIEEQKTGVETRQLPKLRNFCDLLQPATCYRQHLITHLLFIHAFPELLQKLKNESASVSLDNKGSRKTVDAETCMEHLVAGQSLARTSTLTGKSRTYLKRLAELNNISVDVHPRILTPRKREMIVKLANASRAVDYIAALVGVSRPLVQSVIGATPGLKEKRRTMVVSEKKKHYRATLRVFLRKHPNCARSQFQREEPINYYWLYRNDKAWLSSILPSAAQPTAPTRVDWKNRDNRLCAIARSKLEAGWNASSWTKVDHEFGNHGWFLKSRVKLPVSAGLIREALALD